MDVAETRRAPRVVMFRPNTVEHDTRGRKIAASLARGGYDVVMLSCEPPADRAVPVPKPYRMGEVQVVPVRLSDRARAEHRARLKARRTTRLPLIDRTPRDEYVTQVAELRRRVNDWRDRRLTEPDELVPRAGHVWARAVLVSRRARWRAQGGLEASRRRAWRLWDARRTATTRLATDTGMLPELTDYADSLGPALDRLAPDVLHAHHPTVLPLAVRAARRLRARGRDAVVVYDARENYAGIPEAEQGNVRRHAVLVRQEARAIRDCAAVFTVSDPIADALLERYRLAERPTVLLNVPPLPGGVPATGEPAAAATGAPSGPGLREQAGVAPDVPLLVYSGAVSRARGVETLVEALGLLPGVHLVMVTVPYPHPMADELREAAASVGAGDRLHLVPPVPQSRLVQFLAGADLAVHPLPSGSPNHDQALPNKLFEYLHAGLDLVVSDARLMADFVRTHDLGEVFTSGDAADLARAVRSALDRPRADQRDDDGRRRRADLAARFSWDGQEDVLLERYARVAPVDSSATTRSAALPSP